MEYVARAPGPLLASIVDDFYYLAGAPPYPRFTLPPAKAKHLVASFAASYVAFDLVAIGGVDLRTQRWTVRRTGRRT